MPVIRSRDAVVHELHGARFNSYATPSLGSTELCAWRVEVAAGNVGVAHTLGREEVFLVLSGTPHLTIDGEIVELAAGDVAVAPAGCTLNLDNPGNEPASMWVSTSVGFSATLPDGSLIAPPWTR